MSKNLTLFDSVVGYAEEYILMIGNGVSELSEDCKLVNSTYSKYTSTIGIVARVH